MKGRQASDRKPESDRRTQNPSTLQQRWKLAEADRREQDNASALRERLTRRSEAGLHINVVAEPRVGYCMANADESRRDR